LAQPVLQVQLVPQVQQALLGKQGLQGLKVYRGTLAQLVLQVQLVPQVLQVQLVQLVHKVHKVLLLFFWALYLL
jgi:hypothetical protein